MSTKIVVPGREPFEVPGNLKDGLVREMFGADLGLSNMEVSETEENGVKVLTYKHKSGNKG